MPPVQLAQVTAPAVEEVPLWHAVHCVAAIRSASACPAAQATHAFAPSAAYVPTGQAWHSLASASSDAVPAGQTWHRPWSSLRVPGGHAEEQHAAYGSFPIGVVSASDVKPEGHDVNTCASAAQLVQLDEQHAADFFSNPAGHGGLAPH